jgi:hypothetical protein
VSIPTRIPLHDRSGAVVTHAIIDPTDERLCELSWYRNPSGHVVSLQHQATQARMLTLGREVLGLAYGDPLKVEHINGNLLDNRRGNLRTRTLAQTNQRKGAHRGSSSPHRGVCFDRRRNRWYARVTKDYRTYWIGSFQFEAEAAQAVHTARIELMPYRGVDPVSDDLPTGGSTA